MLKRSYKPFLYVLIVIVLAIILAFIAKSSTYMVIALFVISVIPAITRFNIVKFTEDGLVVQNIVYRRKQFISFKEVRKFSLYTDKYFYNRTLSFNAYYPDSSMKSFRIGLTPATEIPHFIELLPEGVEAVDRTVK